MLVLGKVENVMQSPTVLQEVCVCVCTRVKLLGEAAHLLTVVRGHSCTTSFVFSSTRMTDSLVIPSSLGTSLFLPFIFSCRMRKHHTGFMLVRNTYTDDSCAASGQRTLALA